MTERMIAAASLALTALLSAAPGASAHAVLDRADPRAGSTVRTAPSEVKLWFTENLEPAFSTVRVVAADGRPVDRGDGRVDADNPALLRITLSPLPAGAYRVIWRVVSVDIHVTRGEFSFNIAP
jgi:hypothetical protein